MWCYVFFKIDLSVVHKDDNIDLFYTATAGFLSGTGIARLD